MEKITPENARIVRQLNRLIHLDIDAALAYRQAIENIDEPEIRNEVESFQRDHERHVAELAAEILDMGGTPAKPARDVKGFFIEGFTAIRSKMGTESALKAMRSNEHLTTHTYEKALSWDLTPNAFTIVERGFEDEERHLHSIENMIEKRAWERPLRSAI